MKEEREKAKEKIEESEEEKVEEEEERQRRRKGEERRRKEEKVEKERKEEVTEEAKIVESPRGAKSVIPVLEKKAERLEDSLAEISVPKKEEEEEKYERPVVYEKGLGGKYLEEFEKIEPEKISQESKRALVLLPKRPEPEIPIKEEKIELKPEVRRMEGMEEMSNQIRYEDRIKERRGLFEEELDWRKRERKVKKYKERY